MATKEAAAETFNLKPEKDQPHHDGKVTETQTLGTVDICAKSYSDLFLGRSDISIKGETLA